MSVTVLTVFLQAYAIVFLTALNVRNIVAGRYVLAALTGGAISFLWWQNSKATRPSGWRYHAAYTVGAGLGTVFGMWVGR